MAWMWLGVAGLLEIAGRSAEVRRRLDSADPSVFTGLAMAARCVLAQGLKEIPIGHRYAVWTGIGAVGTAILASRCSASRGVAAAGVHRAHRHWPHRPEIHERAVAAR